MIAEVVVTRSRDQVDQLEAPRFPVGRAFLLAVASVNLASVIVPLFAAS